MNAKPVALVTGANKGICLQIAKDLASHGFTVLVGSRDLAMGEAPAKSVADMRARYSSMSPTGIRFVQPPAAFARNSDVLMYW